MAEHTKLPWNLSYRAVLDDGGKVIAGGHVPEYGAMNADYDLAVANAAFIVKACNSHEMLVKALQPLAALAEAVFKKYETEPGVFKEPYSDEPDDHHFYGFNNVSLTYGDLRAARAALSLSGADRGGVS